MTVGYAFKSMYSSAYKRQYYKISMNFKHIHKYAHNIDVVGYNAYYVCVLCAFDLFYNIHNIFCIYYVFCICICRYAVVIETQNSIG